MPVLLLLSLLFLFIIGTAVGSFLNVVSRRLLRGEAITGRSRCESCQKTLSGADLIPLLSFLLLRGRCRYCRARLSWQYPLVEVGTGLLFAALAWKCNLLTINYELLTIIPLLIASSSLIVIFTTDLLEQRVFDQVLLVGVIAAFFYRLAINYLPTEALAKVGHLSPIISDLLLASAVFAFFWFLRLITKGRGMGEGDPPVGFLATLLVGYPQGLVMLFLAFILGAVVGLILIFLKKKKFEDQIPFAPFLASAVFVSIFFGESILSWYLGLLGI